MRAPLAAAFVAAALAAALAIWRSTTDERAAPSTASEQAAPSTTAPAGPRSPARAITAEGKRLPYAGAVPWSDAIADPSDPRALYIEANGDSIKTTKNVCGLPVERVRVTASASQVAVHVDGYARPIAGGCADVGHPLQRLAVQLPSPLGGRTLLDAATQHNHPVLDPATVPTVHGMPANYAATPLTWNDRTGIATRYFTTHAAATQIPCQIGLQYALPGSSEHLAPLAYSQSRAVTIDGRPGSLFTYSETVSHTRFSRWTILWTQANSAQLNLTISGPSATIVGQQVALQLAANIQ